MKEIRIGHTAGDPGRSPVICHSGDHLMQYDIDAAHILSVQGTEEMTAAAAQTGMGVHVLYDMPDILNPMGAAPIPDLTGKIPAP